MKKLGWLLVKVENSIGVYRERFTYTKENKTYIRKAGRWQEVEVNFDSGTPLGYIVEG